ncbi:E3 ubiquitin-protein ligase TRIM71-like [Mytilus californianus]|uniref:E3 ubiquitin-protein ligase TRIM71-like n=1 Tax=Mytilus californianus TaxID=6549 RepID=UPI002246591C|nr:E3 ubiquitin-protein ligase TRIM71-like [Mytilus californianus]
MTTNTIPCGPCSVRQITKPSTHWCAECEEAICDDCQGHHKVLKATRSHELIPIDKYISLPSFITEIQQSCTYHNEKYQQYCVAHTLPICLKCIKEHKTCNVIPLDEVTNNAKTSGHFQDLETRLVDLLQNIDGIKKVRKANLVSIEERKELHLAEIQQIRNQINKHLDKLEKEIILDLEKKERQCKKNIQNILTSVNEKANLITEYQANLQSIKQHASNLQTFLVMRDIEITVFENEQYLQSLVETKKLDPVDLICNVNPGVTSILNSLKNFGSIEIKTTPSSIRLNRAKGKQAQLQVTPTKNINDLKLILKKKITTDGVNVRGCCMSVNGDCFFTDYYLRKKLNVISSDGTFKYSMSLDPCSGFDITVIDEKTIAITSGGSNEYIGIDIIDTDSRKKINFIKLSDHPWGITRDHDSLFVCVEGRGIYKVNIVDYTTSHVISCNLSSYSYVSVFADKIYYTNRSDHSVVCCDRNGSRVWTFRDTLVLMLPRDIALDNDGNVFVIGENSSNLVIISNDGKLHRQVLTKEDGLCGPSAIFFNKQIRKLLVANNKETAFLYSVT